MAILFLLIPICSILSKVNGECVCPSPYGNCYDKHSVSSTCDCNWHGWSHWTPCGRSCGGGTRSRSRSLRSPSCMSSCGKSVRDRIEHGTCSETCFHGGTYLSPDCQCSDGFYGICCEEGLKHIDEEDDYENYDVGDTYGRTCTNDGQCGTSNSKCIDRTCKCSPGYSYQSWNNACVRHCTTYGQSMTQYPGRSIAGHNTRILNSVTMDDCVNACVRETSFLCRTVDYEPARYTCYMQNVGLLDVPSSEWGTGGVYTHGNRDCIVCPYIIHCTNVKCSSIADNICTKCEDQGSDITQSIYYPDSNKKTCQATCSWKQHQCWPGTCSNNLPDTCQCDLGFTTNHNTATCDINTQANILLCNLEITDLHNDTRQTKHRGNSTGCDNQIDVFVNIQPVSITYNIDAHFSRLNKTSPPNYIDKDSTKLGIVKGEITLRHVNLAGRRIHINSTKLYGGGNCNNTIGSTTPAIKMKCDQTTSKIRNGEKICADISIFSGGSFTTIDYLGQRQSTHDFSPLPQKKILCFKYDDASPVHCSSTPKSCSHQPTQLSHRLTRSPNITATIAGWSDPSLGASGIDFYLLVLHKMKNLDHTTQAVDSTSVPLHSEKIRGSNPTLEIPFTESPMMYTVSLEVHDIARNVEYARRYFIYDNTSNIDIRGNAHINVNSASKQTGNKFQINHNSINISWKGYFHNDQLAPFMYKIGGHGNPKEIYDQKTGQLTIKGTKHINGITGFQYSWAVDNGSRNHWSPVPDFTTEKLQLSLNVSDGETYQVWIQAEDISVVM